jgi:hypothetical protein
MIDWTTPCSWTIASGPLVRAAAQEKEASVRCPRSMFGRCLFALFSVCVLLCGREAAAQVPSREAESPKLKLGGEVGFRSEYIANENFAEKDATKKDDRRLRWRARVRLGADYQLDRTVALALRLSTGDNTYPSSGWSSFSDDFRRDLIQIDRAFLNWQALEALRLGFGIQANPLFAPTELLWDSDVQPAGFSEVLTVGKTGLVIAAGQFMLREVRSSKAENEEKSFVLAQGISYTPPIDAFKATAGASFYYFNNPDAVARGIQSGELDGDFKTNRLDPGGRTIPNPKDPTKTLPVDYFSDFQVLDFGLKLEFKAIPLSFAGNVAVNLGARKDDSLGAPYTAKQNVAAGGMLRYGRNKDPWDWVVGAGFFHIEADSVLAVYNSDDLQQTNVNTVPVELQLRFAGGVRLVWDTYIQKKIDTDLASNGGVVHAENASKIRTRLSLLGSF